MRAPAQPKPFSTMSKKLYLGVYLTRRHTGVFSPIPNHDSPVGAHSSDYIWVLWLISSPIYFPLVVDLLHNVEFDLHNWRLFGTTPSVAANLFKILIIVCCVGCHRFGELYMSDLKIVLGLAGSMSTDEEPMSCVVFIRHTALVNHVEAGMLGDLRLLIRQPLSRESGPFERCAKHQIIQEGCVLLPCFVFLIH